ncbi:polyprenyl diphosphate synthase [Rubricoccus marinus]|uniref:Isoprenyl transferase n=1 Tax=Rubricoccus marinus TaxID=716817 RepID=A0A259TXB2_9BACT|nr:polyprenyl diphosphate synthase [Rubricoccus marinus]OZC02267.1 di-trans,poly-cis-decaprenylcistransferase [Rubricoccus marinus]
MQTTLRKGLHVALVMDGNGRWAEQRGLPRTEGHRAGVEAVRRVVRAAPASGVTTLTLYAFSSDNWKRPRAEVTALMGLFGLGLRREVPELKASGVRLTAIGRRDRLPGTIRSALARAEWETRHGTRLHLRLALDYSSRDALCRAATDLASGARAASPEACAVTREDMEAALGRALHPDGVDACPVDLFVRTSGERRLSDFLLWELAYAELLFLALPWPDVTGETLADAVADFRSRQRRFGGLAPSSAAQASGASASNAPVPNTPASGALAHLAA